MRGFFPLQKGWVGELIIWVGLFSFYWWMFHRGAEVFIYVHWGWSKRLSVVVVTDFYRCEFLYMLHRWVIYSFVTYFKQYNNCITNLTIKDKLTHEVWWLFLFSKFDRGLASIHRIECPASVWLIKIIILVFSGHIIWDKVVTNAPQLIKWVALSTSQCSGV